MGTIYNAQWRRLRKKHLDANPWCKRCGARGNVCDHIIPHRGELSLAYDETNLQTLCKQCHDSWKQRLEKTGGMQGCDLTGFPTDPKHPWNKQRRRR